VTIDSVTSLHPVYIAHTVACVCEFMYVLVSGVLLAMGKS